MIELKSFERFGVVFLGSVSLIYYLEKPFTPGTYKRTSRSHRLGPAHWRDRKDGLKSGALSQPLRGRGTHLLAESFRKVRGTFEADLVGYFRNGDSPLFQ